MKRQHAPTPAGATSGDSALDRRQIVQAALALLDESGFDALSMRNLAHKLDIKAASLYWHVRDKHELMNLLAEEICAPMIEPARNQPWQAQLEELGNAFRRVLLAHRDGARILAAAGGPSGPNRLRLSEFVLRTFLDAGFEPQEAAYAGFLVNDYVVKFVLEEAQSAGADDDAQQALRSWLNQAPREQFPSMTALADYLAAPDADERFQFGMDVLRSGLEARLRTPRRPHE